MSEVNSKTKRKTRDERAVKAEKKKETDKERNVEESKSDDECEGENEIVDEDTVIMKKKEIKEDLITKFERYPKLTESIPDYKEQERNLSPAELKDHEEIKQIHDKFNIDFKPDQLSKIIKRGREELNAKRIEYTQKKEDLEAKWRFLKVEKEEVSQKIDSHKLLVDSIEKFKEELVQSQAEIIKLRTN